MGGGAGAVVAVVKGGSGSGVGGYMSAADVFPHLTPLQNIESEYKYPLKQNKMAFCDIFFIHLPLFPFFFIKDIPSLRISSFGFLCTVSL